MAQKMEIPDFSVSKYKCSIIFCRFSRKSLGSVLFSRDGRLSANIHIYIYIYIYFFFFWPYENTALGSFFLAVTEDQIGENYDSNIEKVLNFELPIVAEIILSRQNAD